MRILIVEDDLAVVLALSMVLEQEGYGVATAANGEQALRAVDEEAPDLVLLDLWMPVMDGWQFLERLRSPEHPLHDLPVIVLSADVKARRRNLPVQLFLDKPMDVDRLLHAVRQFVKAP